MRENWQTFRREIARQLHPELRDAPGLSRVNQIIIMVICLSIFFGALETEKRLTESYPLVFVLVHLGLFLFFAAEYVLRVYSAVENPHVTSRLSYMLKPATLTDLLVVLSFMIPFFGTEMVVLRVLRLLRLFRLARLGRFSIAIQRIQEAVSARSFELAFSVVIALALLLLSSTMLYLFERDLQPEDFGSIPRAMWWSIATLTTVGYGDAVPITAMGRFFAALTALTGIGIIAIPTGILASAFSDAMRRNRDRPGE